MKAQEILPFFAAAVAFFSTVAGTWTVLAAARRRGWLDRPNRRSSHRQPTPTLGGLGIVLGVWAGLGVLQGWASEPVFSGEVLWGLAGVTLILLLLAGDDLGRPLRVAEKLALQFLAAAAWLYWGPRLEGLTLPALGRVELGMWSWALSVLWFVWLGNVYNFMDGIDGITAMQTLVAAGWMALYCWHLDRALGSVALLVAGTAAGFLRFNFPPARIFMGDVGSVFIGFWLAVLGLLGERAGVPLWIFLLPLGYYLCDSGYTLARRALRGENLLRAHRKHLYQRLNKLGWSPRRVDMGVLLLGLLLGGGGYAWLRAQPLAGALLLGGGAALLAGVVLWIEYKDRDFA